MQSVTSKQGQQERQDETTAASYERVSTRPQGVTGFSLGAQEKDAVAFARDHGWTLPDHLRFRDGEDRAASGADWDLEGLNAAMDAAKRHEYQVLIVPDPDRFARNMVKALVLEEQLRKYGVRVVYIRMPLEDTAEGRLLKHQLFSIAEYEREKITFRTARGPREKPSAASSSAPVPSHTATATSAEASATASLASSQTRRLRRSCSASIAMRCTALELTWLQSSERPAPPRRALPGQAPRCSAS